MVDFANVNTLAASLLVETWGRLGLEQAVLCPGSRSTPLTVALARHPQIHCLVSLDERSASFFALGQAKRCRRPVLLVCTSGTAGANFLPAIIEAHYSQVPLLVLTADRPAQLRHCHAGQTIDQTRLYGHYPQWQTELGLPQATIEHCQYLRQMAIQAWHRCQWPQLGVVHLNCPFTEPLAPIPDGSTQLLESQLDWPQFYRALPTNQPLTLPKPNPGLEQINWPDFGQRGLMTMGYLPGGETEATVKAVLAIARRLHYPLLVDALCWVRNYDDGQTVIISRYHFLVSSEAERDSLAPDWVLQIGELPTSKPLRSWLGQGHLPRYYLSPNGDNLDPLHGSTFPLPLTIAQLAEHLEHSAPPLHPQQKIYQQQWQRAQQRIAPLIQSELNRVPDTTPALVAQLAELLPPLSHLFVANSLPVRWLEWFWPVNSYQHRVFVNRGANGIDGTLSSAMGMAHRWGERSFLLTGDLSFLHDSNGLLNQGQLQGQLTVILLNNQGGGIFDLLPIAGVGDVFESYFATPQAVDLPQLCRAYGITYNLVKDNLTLKKLLHADCLTPVQVLEIWGDRQREAQWLPQLTKQLGHG